VKVFLVHCHPDPASFTAAVRDRAVSAMRGAGHEVRIADLYADGFDPTLSAAELRDYFRRTEPPEDLRESCANLRWCDTLVFVYPTWWSGQPAMLTGWLDRVLLPGVAFDPPRRGTRVRGRLSNVRRLVMITSHGSRRIINRLEGETGRRVVGRSLRLLCHPLARTTWLALYDIDRATTARRQAFLDRVERRLQQL
jgi:NAD(P)H dehydrogenase (quinone)